MKKRKVLIPLDGSEFSRQIVPVVRGFFDPQDVKLVLLRAATAPGIPPEAMPHDVFVGGMPLTGSYESYNRALESSYSSVDQDREAYRSELQGELANEAERLRSAGYTVTVEIQFGDAAQRIIDYANDSDVDLVAMATHGRTGIGRLVLGSVAERVLRGVTVPVLLMRTAPQPEEQPAPGELLARSLGHERKLNVAVATDGSTHAQQAVTVARELVQRLDANLSLLVTASEREGSAHAQKVMEDACRLVEDLEPRPEAIPLVGYADEELLQYVGKNSVDLLVMGAFHDRGAGSVSAIGPTAQRVVQHAPTSILMLKGRPRPIQKILAAVAVDDQVAVNVAAQFARALKAELHVLHVVPQSAATYLASADIGDIPLDDVLAQGTRLSSVLNGWIDQLEGQGFSRKDVVVRRGNVPDNILEMAHDGHHDLIVVGSQSGPGHFLGSVANTVVRFAEQSVLVVRTRA